MYMKPYEKTDKFQPMSTGDRRISEASTELGGETSNIFYFHPLGKMNPILTSIFFKGVETTN